MLFLSCLCVFDLCICVNMQTCSCLCKLHTSVFVSSVASTWALYVCITGHVCAYQPTLPFALAGSRTGLAASEYSCSSSDAIVWFKELEGADRLIVRKVKITILLLKIAYVVALQVYICVCPSWLSACSNPRCKRSRPPVALVLCCRGSSLLWRMLVYCLSDTL